MTDFITRLNKIYRLSAQNDRRKVAKLERLLVRYVLLRTFEDNDISRLDDYKNRKLNEKELVKSLLSIDPTFAKSLEEYAQEFIDKYIT